MRSATRGLCVFAVLAALLVPTAASAQLPPPPAEIPQLPEPVQSTLATIVGTIAPPATEAAQQLAPVAQASGFLFRPACSTVGTATVALVLAGAYVPVPIGLIGQAVGPFLVYCAYTYSAGPADPVFQQVDEAVGPALSEQLDPLTAQLVTALAPLHAQLVDGCGYSPLLAAPVSSVPPPLNRVDVVKIVCG